MQFISFLTLAAIIPAILATPLSFEDRNSLATRDIDGATNNVAEARSLDSDMLEERDYDMM